MCASCSTCTACGRSTTTRAYKVGTVLVDAYALFDSSASSVASFGKSRFHLEAYTFTIGWCNHCGSLFCFAQPSCVTRLRRQWPTPPRISCERHSRKQLGPPLVAVCSSSGQDSATQQLHPYRYRPRLLMYGLSCRVYRAQVEAHVLISSIFLSKERRADIFCHSCRALELERIC